MNQFFPTEIFSIEHLSNFTFEAAVTEQQALQYAAAEKTGKQWCKELGVTEDHLRFHIDPITNDLIVEITVFLSEGGRSTVWTNRSRPEDLLNKYLKVDHVSFDQDLPAMEFNYSQVVKLSQDASLNSNECNEFCKAAEKGKKLAGKYQRPVEDVKFFVAPESGKLKAIYLDV